MTYGDKIRSMNDHELAEFLSRCVVSDDDYSDMFIYGLGHFTWAEEVEDALHLEISEKETG